MSDSEWADKYEKLVQRKMKVRMELEALRQKGNALEQEYVAIKAELEHVREKVEADLLKGMKHEL